jgi:MFS transporter, SP family, sugar:H+ symporter
MAIATASNWTWNFLLAFFTPFIVSAIDFRYGYVFAACNLFAGFLVYLFVIEGQGRTLEEIDTMYIEHVSPRKSSSWVAPTQAEMARIRREAGTEVAPVEEEQSRGIYSGETERGPEHERKIEDDHVDRVEKV